MTALSHAALPPRGLRAMLAELTPRRIALALGLAALVALVVNPIFATPFPVVLGRLLFIALILLLAFTAAGAWQIGRVPRWLGQVIAVALVAPLATLLAYLPTVGSDVQQLFQHEGLFRGVLLVTSTALIIAPLLALGALYRERDAQARSQALAFELERSNLERQALDARLKLLQAQVEPHFLFNTLANVQELVESGSPRAGPVLASLIAYLRAAMPRLHDEHPTLANEVALVRAYLELMQMRMPDRLQFRVDVDPALASQQFPAMALLTLVENAVRHGIDPSEQGGRIDVSARRDGDTARITVADTGVGLRETASGGTGLANLRARLEASFGSAARLEMHEVQPSGVRAEVVLNPVGEARR